MFKPNSKSWLELKRQQIKAFVAGIRLNEAINKEGRELELHSKRHKNVAWGWRRGHSRQHVETRGVETGGAVLLKGFSGH